LGKELKMSDNCTTLEEPTIVSTTEPTTEQKDAGMDEALMEDTITLGLSFLEGLGAEIEVFVFIDKLTRYDSYTLLKSIKDAHETLAGKALSAFVGTYYPELTDPEEVEACLLVIAETSELWWSIGEDGDGNTVMIRNELSTQWTPFYSFNVNMIAARDLGKLGAIPLTARELETYEQRYGEMTPGIVAKVVLPTPIRH
jgi:hypothetical protein